MSQEEIDQLVANSYAISNKEALRDKIHEIHNYLRNNGVGYGMNGLKIFNILYGLKKIEENGLADKIQLPNEYRFSNLYNLALKYEDLRIGNLISGLTRTIYNSQSLRDFLTYSIPNGIKPSVYLELIKQINTITTIEKSCNVLLSGKIYEYFIGRDDTAISELGAYFTDRHIVEYILEKVKPTLDTNNNVKTMTDMFGGSGGFTTGYINYLNKVYPGKINWNTNIENVHHFDMNEDVIKSAALEFLCLTGSLPSMKYITYTNSFKNEFSNRKYSYVLTNPPYGGDKQTTGETQMKRKKLMAYIKSEIDKFKVIDKPRADKLFKQLKLIEAQEKEDKINNDITKVSVINCSDRIRAFAANYKLTGNDKESCSLILIADMLDVGGTGVGVLKEGVFFNKVYKDLRKCITENYNVREIISIPADQFENTATKTSIIIFDNIPDKITQHIRFSEIIVEKVQEDKFEFINDQIVLIENAGDICKVTEKHIRTVPVADILTNEGCSWSEGDYNTDVMAVNPNYELKPLNDICKIELGTRILKNESSGNIPVYGGGDITFYTDTPNREKNTLIISRYAMSKTCVRLIPNKFYLNDSGLSIRTTNNTMQPYINYYFLLSGTQTNIYTNYTIGSIQRNVNMTKFKLFPVPVPKNPEKITYWTDRISKPYDKKISKEAKVKELEEQITNMIKDIINNEDCETVTLGNICEIKSGKPINANKRLGSLYPYYAANGISGYVDSYLFDGNYIICAQDGSIGATYIVNTKFYASNHVWILSSSTVTLRYLYYILKHHVNYKTIITGSVISKLNKEKLENIKIKIPKDKSIIKNMEPLFQEVETLQNDIKKSDELYNQYLNELAQDIANVDAPMDSDNNDEEEIIVIRKVSNKIRHVTKE